LGLILGEEKENKMRLVVIRRAEVHELPFLAQMNKQLIDDEGSPNPMNMEQLVERMRGWFFADWNIDMICNATEIVGYALYHFRELNEVYLRQYFIRSEFRNLGYGQEGMNQLRISRFQNIKTITIDVLESNPIGMNFWKKVGFIPYCTTMKMTDFNP
jgi:RimJ/RimL family protein N-acetyltransferase